MNDPHGDGNVHVVPTDDLREHHLSVECWCKPVEDEGVVIHNSMDRREEYEEGKKPT